MYAKLNDMFFLLYHNNYCNSYVIIATILYYVFSHFVLYILCSLKNIIKLKNFLKYVKYKTS